MRLARYVLSAGAAIILLAHHVHPQNGCELENLACVQKLAVVYESSYTILVTTLRLTHLVGVLFSM